MQKRGQVTAFIILGVIIVILVAIGIYYRDSLKVSLSSIGISSGITVPKEFEQISVHVESCIDDISEDGIRLLGSQGGYISIPNDIAPASPANPFSNKLLIFQNGDMEVPYWYYITANNIPKNVAPSLASMEKALATYIDNNLDECIDNFTQYTKFETNAMQHKTTVNIEKEKVQVDINFPISAKIDSNEYNFKEFKRDINAGLGKLYSMALQIQQSETETNFLEDKTYDILVLYEEIPLSETDLSCTPKIWSKQKVTQDLKEFLSYNVPMIKIKGTNYQEGEKYFEWEALETSYDDTSANLMYSKSWPLMLEVYPSQGDLLKGDEYLKKNGGEQLSYISSLVCINQYHFVYDIKHPVLITLHDDKSFGGTGLDFEYATMVVIDNNQPKENKAADLELPDDTTNEICKYANSEATVNVLRPTTGTQHVTVPDAEVSYKCITSKCDIGKTGNDGSITAKFPACVNGAVIANKDGFHEGKTIFSTNTGGSTSVLLEPYYTLALDVKILSPNIRNALAGEKIIITLTNEERDYTTSIVFPETREIKLLEGKYHATSFITEDGPEITIQGKEVEHCQNMASGFLGIFGAEEEKCSTITIPPTKVQTVIKGGAEFNFTATRENLQSANKLTIYTVSEKTPSTYDEMASSLSNIKTNSQKTYFIYPRLDR